MWLKADSLSVDRTRGLTTHGTLLLFLATLVLYISTATFCIAGYVAAFAVNAEEVASANAAWAHDIMALFNPLRTGKFVSKMSCIQTAALTINVSELYMRTSRR